MWTHNALCFWLRMESFAFITSILDKKVIRHCMSYSTFAVTHHDWLNWRGQSIYEKRHLFFLDSDVSGSIHVFVSTGGEFEMRFFWGLYYSLGTDKRNMDTSGRCVRLQKVLNRCRESKHTAISRADLHRVVLSGSGLVRNCGKYQRLLFGHHHL